MLTRFTPIRYPNEIMGYQFNNSLEQKVFVSKHAIFLEKNFLLRDSGNKVELRKVQGAQTDVDQLPKPEANIHKDEIEVDPSEAQALHRSSRVHTIPKRYGFLISE